MWSSQASTDSENGLSNGIIGYRKVLTLWKIEWFHHGYLDGIFHRLIFWQFRLLVCGWKMLQNLKMFKMRTSDMFCILAPVHTAHLRCLPSRLNLPDVDRFLPFTISSIKWPVIVSVTHLVFIRSSLNINTTAIEKITNYLIFATSLLSHQLTNFMTDSPVTWKPKSRFWKDHETQKHLSNLE